MLAESIMRYPTAFRVCMTIAILGAVMSISACSWLQGLPGFAWFKGPDLPALPPSEHYGSVTTDPAKYQYLIGPGDTIQIFVWRNPEVSQSVTVRPDGSISTPLIDNLKASGKTNTQLAREIEGLLAVYIREPIVTVIVQPSAQPGALGNYSEQVRVMGQAARPQAIPYRTNMTLLDIMIQVGGTTEFAAGNKATILRVVNNKPTQFRVRLDDLLKDGDISANVDMLPGDILIIPESWF